MPNKRFLALFAAIFALNFVFFTYKANAGILSFIERIFNLGVEKEFISPQTAANIPLLEAPKNADTISADNLNIINIVDNSAVMASAGPLGTILDIKNTPSTKISVYTVREGDTLSEISEMFNVDINTIRFANDLKKGGFIKRGQKLIILPIPGVSYITQKGDTLHSIAKKFSGDESEISRFNDLDTQKELVAGISIIIPNGEIAEVYEEIPKSPNAKKYLTPSPFYAGYYLRPIEGGKRSQGIHGYNGVDLAVNCGTPIFSSADGEVIISKSSGWNGGYGKYIVINHTNGTQTLYSHNSSNVVFAGDYVKKGELIGYIGITGFTTGCHVHFEIRGAKNPF